MCGLCLCVCLCVCSFIVVHWLSVVCWSCIQTTCWSYKQLYFQYIGVKLLHKHTVRINGSQKATDCSLTINITCIGYMPHRQKTNWLETLMKTIAETLRWKEWYIILLRVIIRHLEYHSLLEIFIFVGEFKILARTYALDKNTCNIITTVKHTPPIWTKSRLLNQTSHQNAVY